AGIANWMSAQKDLAEEANRSRAPGVELTNIVVTKENLNFGTALVRDKLKVVEWPATSVPEGAFHSIAEVFAEQHSRVVLEAMRGNEPVLRGKITGPGQRATLSTMLGKGMKAVAIRVNDVIGVGGFVLPGDRVDILLTQTPAASASKKADKPGEEPQAYTDLLLRNVRVLAIDQSSDPKQEAPRLVRTVTVETSLADSQKVTLAATVGTLSLVLSESGAIADQASQPRITVSDLAGDNGDIKVSATLVPSNAVADEKPAVPSAKAKPVFATVNVVRAIEQKEYAVSRSRPAE
ncbi:MAG: Flp pilus assembly protein CpaB, partial [Hyphomicrobium sp.]